MYKLVGNIWGRPFHREVSSGEYRIGRGPENEIDLQTNSVSRRHATLTITPSQILLRDLGSRNGTRVNGKPLIGSTVLQPGDRLTFADIELVFALADEAVGESTLFGPLGLPVTFAAPHEVSAGARLSSDEAISEQGGEAFDRLLFRAVTEAGSLLVAPRPLQETFAAALDIVGRVIPARRILLLLTDTPDGAPVVRARRPAQAADEKLMMSSSILNTVMHDREALLLDDASIDPRFSSQQSVVLSHIRSAMVAPLFDREQTIGVLYVDSDDPRVHYGRDQLRAFTLMANLVAAKITHARLMEAEQERVRLASEAAAAKRVQETILPSVLPEIAGYELAARQIPCHEVGGDLYDAFRLENGKLYLVVGDVSGKGMPAALLMSNVIACLRMLYTQGVPLSELAARVDAEVLASSDALHFVTLFIALLDPQTNRLEYVNGGHNPPLLMRPGADVQRLDSTSVPLGLLAGTTFETRAVELPAGSVLCVFSDGIPDAQRGDEEYGDSRVMTSIERRVGYGLDELADGILSDLREFQGDEPLPDDVTLVVLRRR